MHKKSWRQLRATRIFIYTQGVTCNATHDFSPTYSHLTKKSLEQKLNGTGCIVGVNKKNFEDCLFSHQVLWIKQIGTHNFFLLYYREN